MRPDETTMPGGDGRGDHKQSDSNEEKGEPPYEFSLDPDTRAAEKKLRRVVAKQVLCAPRAACAADLPGSRGSSGAKQKIG